MSCCPRSCIRNLENVPLTLMTARAADLMHRHARSRLHHRARHRRRRLGHQGGDRQVACCPGRACSSPAAPSARRAATAIGAAAPIRRALPLLQRAVVLHGRSPTASTEVRKRGARADAPGLRPGEDHDVGRRRLALRSARQPAVLRRTRWRPPSRRRTPSAAMSARTPTRRRRSRARPTPACAPSSTAI